MNRAVKITLAVLVFVAGISLALVYRRSAPCGLDLLADNAGRLVLHGPRWTLPPQPKAVSSPFSPENVGSVSDTSTRPSTRSSSGSLAQKSTVLTPIDTGMPPPRLARVFPRNEDTMDSPWSYALGRSHNREDTHSVRLPVTHIIVDGDTLEGLALRYLGDSSRGQEIYEANRHILLNPHVLPIGVELLIPGGQQPAHRAEGLLPDKPLVPVAPVQN